MDTPIISLARQSSTWVLFGALHALVIGRDCKLGVPSPSDLGGYYYRPFTSGHFSVSIWLRPFFPFALRVMVSNKEFGYGFG